VKESLCQTLKLSFPARHTSLEAAKEALDDTILRGNVGRDELLAPAIIAAGGAKTPTLKNDLRHQCPIRAACAPGYLFNT
jgi:hypothetical protein